MKYRLATIYVVACAVVATAVYVGLMGLDPRIDALDQVGLLGAACWGFSGALIALDIYRTSQTWKAE